MYTFIAGEGSLTERGRGQLVGSNMMQNQIHDNNLKLVDEENYDISMVNALIFEQCAKYLNSGE